MAGELRNYCGCTGGHHSGTHGNCEGNHVNDRPVDAGKSLFLRENSQDKVKHCTQKCNLAAGNAQLVIKDHTQENTDKNNVRHIFLPPGKFRRLQFDFCGDVAAGSAGNFGKQLVPDQQYE